MIVVGINVAPRFDVLKQADKEARYLADLKGDLATDIEALDNTIASNGKKSGRRAKYIGLMPQLAELPAEEQTRTIQTPAGYQFFEPSDFTYCSMQESGDVRLLMSNETKNSLPKLDRRHKLIALLPSNYLQALDHGDIALMMARFDIASMHVTDPALSDKQPLTNFFVCTIQDTEGMLQQYRLARSDRDDLLRHIDASIGDQPLAGDEPTQFAGGYSACWIPQL